MCVYTEMSEYVFGGAPPSLLPHLSTASLKVTDVPLHLPSSYVGVGDGNSGPEACTESSY